MVKRLRNWFFAWMAEGYRKDYHYKNRMLRRKDQEFVNRRSKRKDRRAK